MALVNWRIRENSRNVVGVTAGIIEGIELTGMATQSSISVRGSSEQKVPSVRKGGRGGGGNRNSGGGPGHSGHSVLSSVSSSSILHLSVLKTTWKINARLILLTELLIGTWEKLYLLPKAAPPLVIYSSSFPLACRSSFQLARHRSFFFTFFLSSEPELFAGRTFSPEPWKPSYPRCSTCLPLECRAKRLHGKQSTCASRKSRYSVEQRSYVREPDVLLTRDKDGEQRTGEEEKRKRRREAAERKGQRWAVGRINSLATGIVEGKQAVATAVV